MATQQSSYSSSKYFWCARDRLGDGRTSLVFAGYRRDNGSRIAVKMFQPSFDSNAIQREIQAMEAIGDHDNIVKLFEVDEERLSKVRVIVMELCTGGSLQEILDSPENGYGLGEVDFTKLISDLTDGLAHMRQCNFAHRDIKPKNILKFQKSDGTYVFKLGDFGTARELEDDETFQSFCGTREYLHPAIHKSGTASAKVDLWSVGVTFFYAATGREPFKCEDNENLVEIISKKESGVIYGWQLEPNNPPEYGRELPHDIQISRGLRNLIEPVLRRLMENDLLKMIGFDNFFDSIQAIVQKKVVDVFCVCSCSIHKIYIDPEEPDGVMALKKLIHRQAGIDPVTQELFYENLPYSPRELIPASKLPNTTPDHPFVVFGGPPLKLTDLEKLIISTIPQVPHGTSSAKDIHFGKECCKSAWMLKSAAENLNNLHKLMHRAAQCIRHTVRNECQQLEQLLQSVEQANSAVCKVLSSQIAGLNSQTQLVAALMPATSVLLDFLKQETATKEAIFRKIQGVLPPLKQKINNQIKLEASTVADMWDPQLARDIFHRGIDVLQYMVQCVDSGYNDVRRKAKSRDTFEHDAHEWTKSQLHKTLAEAQQKVLYLNSERETVFQLQGVWLLRCASLRSTIGDVTKNLCTHFEDCNRYLLDLEQWEKNFIGRLRRVQQDLVSHCGPLKEMHFTSLQHVQDNSVPCPSDQVMGELQKANGECTKTVELQKVLLVMVADLVKSLSEVTALPGHK
ncbi:hypothetical protein EMCRGX_G001021 [Ephydatia muelleri]